MTSEPRRARRGPWAALARAPRPPRALRPELASLEPRALLSAVTDLYQPTAAEQYFLQLVNRARANPAAEGARLVALAQTDPVLKVATQGWDLGQFLRVVSSYTPGAPLAFDTRLIEAARDWSNTMLAANMQYHSPRGYLTNTALGRADDGRAYFPVTPGSSYATGENIFAYSENVGPADPAGYAAYFEASFLIDWGNPGFGHLRNLLAPGPGGWTSASGHSPYNLVGIGMLTGVTPTAPPGPNNPVPANQGLDVGPAIVSQEFAYRAGAAYLTGCIYSDANADGFYNTGEGLGGVTVRATGAAGQGTFVATTWASGGYTLALPPGVYDVSALGGGLSATATTRIAVGVDNVGWDVSARPTQADQPVPADYSGDGRTDLAVYRASTAQWFVDGRGTPLAFGAPGLDVPLPGDYDGIGRAEPAVYRPTTGQWFVMGPNGGRLLATFGAPGLDVPLPGDYDGDGRVEPAVYRPSTAQWFVLGPGGGRQVATFGAPNLDVPVPGDYDGVGGAEVAVYRPITAEWFVLGPGGGRKLCSFGQPNVDVPVPGDYDGDGRVEPAVYRPTTGQVFILSSTGPRVLSVGNGTPVRGDFDGDGRSDPAVFTPATAGWVAVESGGGTLARSFGQPGVASAPSTWLTRWSRGPTAANTLWLGVPQAQTESRNVTPPPPPRPVRPNVPPPPPRRSEPRWWEPLLERRHVGPV